MPESVYDVILLIGSSKESWEKAAANAVEQASKSLRDLRVAEIVELDMQLDAKGKVEAYRAKVRLSFKVERLRPDQRLLDVGIGDACFRQYPLALQFMDGRRLRAPHDVKRDGLVGVAPEATNLQIAVSRIERVAQRWRRLRRPLKAEHALVPRLAREPVGFLARFGRTLCRRPDRRPVNGLA